MLVVPFVFQSILEVIFQIKRVSINFSTSNTHCWEGMKTLSKPLWEESFHLEFYLLYFRKTGGEKNHNCLHKQSSGCDWGNFLRNLLFVLKGIHWLVNENIYFSEENVCDVFMHLWQDFCFLSSIPDFSLVTQFSNATERTSAVEALLDKTPEYNWYKKYWFFTVCFSSLHHSNETLK